MFRVKEEVVKMMKNFVRKEYVPATASANGTVWNMGGCMDCSNSCAENCAVKCKASKR